MFQISLFMNPNKYFQKKKDSKQWNQCVSMYKLWLLSKFQIYISHPIASVAKVLLMDELRMNSEIIFIT